jgi:hypothetical protein
MEKKNHFCLIQTSDGYQGWVDTKGLTHIFRPEDSCKKVKLLHNANPVYPFPQVKNKPLSIFPFEVDLKVLMEPTEEEGRWIQIELFGGKVGWIQRGHVRFDNSPLSLSEMLQLSRQFLGLPYIWGGISSFGFDCSGFIQMLWRQRGIILPRDAGQQFNHAACHLIEWESLQPGDLIFYGSCAQDIRHVGLYLGDQTLIHATVKTIPMVQESYLDEPSLRKRFAYRSARRWGGHVEIPNLPLVDACAHHEF